MDQTFLVVIIAAITGLAIVLVIIALKLQKQKKAAKLNEQFDETRWEVHKTLFHFWLQDRFAEWMKRKPQPLLPPGKDLKLLEAGSNPLSVVPGKQIVAVSSESNPKVEKETATKEADKDESAEPEPNESGSSGTPPPPQGPGITHQPSDQQKWWRKKRYVGGGAAGLLSILIFACQRQLLRLLNDSASAIKENIWWIILFAALAAIGTGTLWHIRKKRKEAAARETGTSSDSEPSPDPAGKDVPGIPKKIRSREARKKRYMWQGFALIIVLSVLLTLGFNLIVNAISSMEWFRGDGTESAAIISKQMIGWILLGILILVVLIIIGKRVPWNKVGESVSRGSKLREVVSSLVGTLIALAVLYLVIVAGIGYAKRNQEIRDRQALEKEQRAAEISIRPSMEITVTSEEWTRFTPPGSGVKWSVIGNDTLILTEIDLGGTGRYFFPGLTEPPFDMTQFEPSHRRIEVVTTGPFEKRGVYTKATVIENNVPRGKLSGGVNKRSFRNAKPGTVTVRFTEKSTAQR